MGKLKALRMKKLKAISVVESMVAMVLIVLSFGAGMALFLQVMTTDRLTSHTRARVVLQQVMVETKQTQRYLNETLELEGLTIEKKIETYPAGTDTYVLHLQAMDSKYEQLVHIREILYLPQL